VHDVADRFRQFSNRKIHADACLFLMQHYEEPDHINVGVGVDLSIRELAEAIRDIVHPAARLVFDRAKPDGTPRKLLNVDRLHALGWRHRVELREGIASANEALATGGVCA
jgi:GDP-L-fucose synthase